MNILKLLVVVMFLIVEITTTETRDGKYWHSRRKPSTFRRTQNFKKPNLLSGHIGHRFRSRGHAKPTLPEDDLQLQQLSDDSILNEDDLRFSFNQKKRDDYTTKNRDTSSQLFISENGDVRLGRALNFNQLKNFHDADDFEQNHDHDHLNEDHDHIHKNFRTVRNVKVDQRPRPRPGRPETLAATLGEIQQQNMGTQLIDVAQGTQAWDNLELNASGGSVTVGSSGSSDVSGSGTFTSTGTTSITNGGSSANGWRSTPEDRDVGSGNPQTYQGITASNSAHAGEYVDVQASGIEVSFTSSGSSSSTGTGTISVYGSTNVQNSNGGDDSGSSGGWKSP